MKQLTKWNGHEFSSAGTVGEDFKAFARDYKKFIKKVCRDNNRDVKISVGHYDIHGFITNISSKKCMYFSTSDVRIGNRRATNILVRTAKDNKDFTGGTNQYTELLGFEQKCIDLLTD